MSSTQTPAYEVTATLVDAFRTDTDWSDAATVGDNGGLLYPLWSPRKHADDWRVWGKFAVLPEDSATREALPRITLEARWTPHNWEQEQAGILQGAVTVYLHTVVPRAREEYGDSLATAAILKVLSTPLSSARIIAAELVQTSDIGMERISAFNGASEWIATFRSQNVGVLQ